MAENRYFALIPQTTVFSKELNALSASTRWIYVVMIAERHGLDAPFRIPYWRISEITGFTDPTIRQAVKDLDAAGFLNYEHGGLERNPNIYDLDKQWLML